MIRVVIKNKHKMDTKYHDIYLYAHYLDIVLGSIFDTFGRIFHTLISQD